MNASRDPFGFEATSRPVQGTNPIVVVAQPGQELRIVVPDDTLGAGESGETGTRGDSRGVSGRGSGDSRGVSGPGSGDSRGTSGPGGGDTGRPDPFAFSAFPRRFSPTPITIIARSGQEIRVVIAKGPLPAPGFSGDSRGVSGPGGGDRR